MAQFCAALCVCVCVCLLVTKKKKTPWDEFVSYLKEWSIWNGWLTVFTWLARRLKLNVVREVNLSKKKSYIRNAGNLIGSIRKPFSCEMSYSRFKTLGIFHFPFLFLVSKNPMKRPESYFRSTDRVHTQMGIWWQISVYFKENVTFTVKKFGFCLNFVRIWL